MIEIIEEKMGKHFVKHHLEGLPFNAVIHHFSCLDNNIHDHPFGFTSHILSGGYVEKVFHVGAEGNWRTELITRLPGTVHRIKADHIHQIVELLAGECYTLIIPEPKIRESRFWKFDESGSESRAWFEGDYQ